MFESWLLACALVAFSVFGVETCDVEIVQYCCRKRPLDFADGFELICNSNDQTGSEIPDPAFSIQVRSDEFLTVEHWFATPNVPSLLSYLNVTRIADFVCLLCEVPQGNLSFARIFEGNERSLEYMKWIDPQEVSNRTLKGDVFGGLEADIRNFDLVQFIGRTSLELDENFFKGFKSLETLRLAIFCTRIPSGLKSLTKMTSLEISKMKVSEISPDAFSGLESLEKLIIDDVPIANFGTEPFSDLKNLTYLCLKRLNAVELPAKVFWGLTSMKVLEIKDLSKLATIHAEVFDSSPNLSRLTLHSLPLLEELPAGLINELGQLSRLHIENCGLKSLALGLWPGQGRSSSNLKTITITRGVHETLPEYFFVGNDNLQRLNLEYIHLNEIGKSLRNVSSLQHLDLIGNNLTSILNDDFKDLEKLISLKLDKNGISSIERGSFENLVSLQLLTLSNNKLHHFESVITAKNRALMQLNLINNLITDFPNILLENLSNFTLALDDNLLDRFDVPLLLNERTIISLRRNRIGVVSIPELPELTDSSPGSHISLIDDNPFLCTGDNFVFLKYIQEFMRPDVAEFQNLTNCFCRDTETPLTAVNTEELFTAVEGCAQVCECYKFPSNSSTDVRCRNQNLTTLPMLPPGVTELDLEDNSLTAFPVEISEYRLLRVVNLRGNRLKNIDGIFSSAPRSLRYLYVESNELERLDVDPNATPGFNVALSDNPWICDCDAINFKIFIDKNEMKILDYPNIKCVNALEVNGSKEFLLSRIPLDILCPYPAFPTWILGPSIAVPAILVQLGVLLFFGKRATQSEFLPNPPDESKEFDAFLSYATEDREIAMEVLRKLESVAETANNSDVRFKLCCHERDFAAGQPIKTNILKAVRSSHRTILILSQQFLQSSWFTIEFETAYDQMLEDRSFGLIIIIRGEISKMKSAYGKLDAFLSAKTYLVWGERWFWKKLFKAMPHEGLGTIEPGHP